MSSFLNLPGELHLQIFYALSTTSDAVNLARTCSQLHDLYNDPKTKINILLCAANVPSKFACDRECAWAGTSPSPFVLEGIMRLIYIQTVRGSHPGNGGYGTEKATSSL